MNLTIRKTVLLTGLCATCMLGTPPRLWATQAYAVEAVQQTKKIKGTVSDNMGPIIGANVLEKGTTNGVITDIDGNFELNVAPGATIVISFLGYTPREIKITNQTTLDVMLQEDSEMLEEVVVVGYGTMKKSDLSGASVSMGEDDLKGSIITNLDQSLQGRAAGVTAVTTSGAPGSSSSIRIRGQATINANAEPLYVIDGVIVQGGGQSGADFGLGDALGNGSVSTISPLSTINPADIVSMEILKDASATAIYGAQGANGVVLITTKRGKSGEAKFTYDGMFAVQRQTKRLDIMDLREYANFYNDFVSVGEADESPYLSDVSVLGKGTNWQDAIFQTAMQHQHQVSAQGGSDKIQYYVSGSYMDQEGTIIGSEFSRFSVRTNLDTQLKKWLKLGLSATYSSTDESLKLADSSEGLINYSLTTIPSIPIYNVDGSYSSVSQEGYTNPNPVALALMDDILLNRQKLTGNIFAEITPIKNLVWHAELGYDISASKAERYEPMVDLGTWNRDSNSSSIQKNSSTFWQLKNYLTYNGSFKKHSYSVMLGQEMWKSDYNFSSVANTDLPSDVVHNPALGDGTPTINYGFGSSTMASFFARATYNYDDRYLATYTYRYDGSSNFGPENRWAGFHAIAASWRFSNEKFFEPLRNIISNGKLRVGWGQTGNANIGGYRWGSAISIMPTGLGMSYRPANIANTGIKWESQEQINIGLDLGFFNDRVNLTVDWYRKESKDMLMQLQLPSYMGTSGNASSALAAPWGNYGHIRNTGVELTLNTHPLIGEFQWDSDFQISVNRNKLVALSGTSAAQIVGYGQWTDVVTVTNVGESLYNFYGYVTDGVYESLEDIQTSPKPANSYPGNGVFNKNNTVWVGDIKYKDLNGDGVIDENDRTNLGSPMPKFTFGWTNTFRYKNFDLSLFINGSVGNKVFNYMSMSLTHMNSTWTNQLNSVNGRARIVPINANKDYSNGVVINGTTVWHWYDDITNVRVANPGTSIPRATINDPNDNDRVSDRYIENGTYVRLKNITLGYTFPKKWTNKWHIENLRLYANIQNLLTITGYDGYDPEIGVSTSAANVMGLDNGRYPSPTVYSFGLNVTF
ncbi:TonB-dependent receptor [Bacteroides sp. ET71]|uniref:SusC/RagA family TonB-linked outer membrane protein n=1 Tax=Bacteroides sp. ET71 TaxID=2939421 RepID=UPI002010D12E|nr:TonB-dependent receptor [Bacteroides sp. ET71]MCL1616594.1 TonB-dependent receptor [Bacteroides sp. ET71]